MPLSSFDVFEVSCVNQRSKEQKRGGCIRLAGNNSVTFLVAAGQLNVPYYHM